MLARRAARRPGDELAVDVRAAPDVTLRALNIGPAAVRAHVEAERERLLAPLSGVARALRSPAMALAMGTEYRSEKRYREQVERYLAALEEQLTPALAARAVLHEVARLDLDVARLDLDVVNTTDRTFTDVRVDVVLPGAGVRAWDWREDARRDAELAAAPAPFGSARPHPERFVTGLSALAPFNPAPGVLRVPLPSIERRGDALCIALSAPAVRAQGTTSLRSVWLVIADPATAALPVTWEATATNADRRVTGSLTVAVQPPPVSVAELLVDPPDDD